jgi:hypothetical protein
MRNRNSTLLLILILFCLSFSERIFAGGEEKLTIEIRAAAHPARDKEVVETAKEGSTNEIYENDSLIAKWVPALKRQKTDLSDDPNLVTRRREDGNIELLVLVGTEDVTEEEVREIRRGINYLNGSLALDFELNDAGEKKLRKLSRNCLYQRYLAQIIDGQVYRALPVVSILVRNFQIPGDFSEAEIQQIAERSKEKFTEEYVKPPYAITVTPFRFIIFLIFLFLLIFSVFPARGLKKSNYPKLWIIISALIFALVGGYTYGVSELTGRHFNDPETPPWATVININLTGVALGALVGSVLGIIPGFVLRFVIRRGLYNVARTFNFIFRKVGLPELYPILKSKAFFSSYNKKQKAVIILCILLLSILFVFPPWTGCKEVIITEENPDGVPGSDWEFMGFHYILFSEFFFVQTPYLIHRIHYTLLFSITGMIVVGGYVSTRLLKEK